MNDRVADELEAATSEADTFTFRVSDADAGARLDAYLAARIADRSRTRIKHLIEDGDVTVEGRTAKPSHKLNAGEFVEIETIAPPPLEITPENIPVEVVYEDEHLIVVNKPAGLVMHPGAGIRSGTLAHRLAFHFNQLSTGGGALRPGIVHRLDRDTSGLVVIAKNEATHEKLSDQFRAREVFKSYVALVHGLVSSESGSIEQPIARDPRHRTRMAVVRSGRSALTLYRVRQYFKRWTLLDVEIKTGRTHQIRVHMAWLKHPVVGDQVYGAGRNQSITDTHLRAVVNRLGRLFLHAEQLGFRHPRTGDRLHFTQPLPHELAEFLANTTVTDYGKDRFAGT